MADTKDAHSIDLPIEHITWHGNEIAFHRCGNGEPVVLIHGIASSFDTWNGVLPELGKVCTAVAPDLLGHGRSSKPRGDYSLGAFATGVRDFMEALDIPAATLVGHSMGGGMRCNSRTSSRSAAAGWCSSTVVGLGRR